MIWVQRVVGAVFVLGVAALVASVVTLALRADTVPPLPIYLGILGLVALVMLAGACMALISIAVSARWGAESLSRLAAQGPAPAARVFSGGSLREIAQPQAKPARPATRRLVAER